MVVFDEHLFLFRQRGSLKIFLFTTPAGERHKVVYFMFVWASAKKAFATWWEGAIQNTKVCVQASLGKSKQMGGNEQF